MLLVAETQAACLLTVARGTKTVKCIEGTAIAAVDTGFVLLTSHKYVVGALNK